MCLKYHDNRRWRLNKPPPPPTSCAVTAQTMHWNESFLTMETYSHTERKILRQVLVKLTIFKMHDPRKRNWVIHTVLKMGQKGTKVKY